MFKDLRRRAAVRSEIIFRHKYSSKKRLKNAMIKEQVEISGCGVIENGQEEFESYQIPEENNPSCETPDADETPQQIALANINFFPNPQSLMAQAEEEVVSTRKKGKGPEDSLASQSTLEGSELKKTPCGTPVPKQPTTPASEYWDNQKQRPPLPPSPVQEGVKRCKMHPKKKAKFYVAENPGQQFCSKCAIEKAIWGSKIQHVLTSDEYTRKSESEKFILSAEKTIFYLQNAGEKCSKAKEIARNLLGKEIQRVKYSFLVLEQVLEDEKSRCISELNRQFSLQLVSVDSFVKSLEQQEKELSEFVVDTKNNMELIIKKMEMAQFKNIISFYNQKIQETRDAVDKSTTRLEVPSFQLRMSAGALEKVRQIVSESIKKGSASLNPLDEDLEEKVRKMVSVSSILPEFKQVENMKKGEEVSTPSVDSRAHLSFKDDVGPLDMNSQYEMMESFQLDQPNLVFKREESKPQALGPSASVPGQDPLTISSDSDAEAKDKRLSKLRKYTKESESKSNSIREERERERYCTVLSLENLQIIQGEEPKDQFDNPFECLRNIAMENGLINTELLSEGHESLEALAESYGSMGKNIEGSFEQRIKQNKRRSIKIGEIDLAGERAKTLGDGTERESLYVTEKSNTCRSIQKNEPESKNDLSIDSETVEKIDLRKKSESQKKLQIKQDGSQSQRLNTSASLTHHKQANTSSSKHLSTLALMASPSNGPSSTIYKNLLGQKHPQGHPNTTAGECFSHGSSLSSQSLGSNGSSQNPKNIKSGLKSQNNASGIISAFGRDRPRITQVDRVGIIGSSTPRSSRGHLPKTLKPGNTSSNRNKLAQMKEEEIPKRKLSSNTPMESGQKQHLS